MRKIFKQPEGESAHPWHAYDAAVRWCADNGYATGSMQRGAPTGVHREPADIAKWRNLTRREKAQLDGTLKSIWGPRESNWEVDIRLEQHQIDEIRDAAVSRRTAP